MTTAGRGSKKHNLILFEPMAARNENSPHHNSEHEPKPHAQKRFSGSTHAKTARRKQELLLTDHIPQLVEQVLSRAGHDAENSRRWCLRVARSDGRSRARGHVSPRQLMDTYQGLRENVFLHLDAELASDRTINAGERKSIFQRLGNALDEAVRDAVSSFMVERTKKLQRLARTDGLTNLYNHRTFYERLEQEAQRAVRYGAPLSIALIDLDNFKIVNDTLGHQSGDKLLKLCAEVLRKELRATDVVCRYGGDEFAIILPETDRDEARAILKRLPAKLAECGTQLGAPACFGMSFGIATHPDDCSATALVHYADKLLLKNKRRHHSRDTGRLTAQAEAS
ncbi:MAG: GGDEF domain-containing protein [Pyrinomonadaceae bacterium MAG19_C2-C3]|nr:GGDEF domain-containing protein [Pyrinomonadaceae bacterium MAG19_C2-C3]